MSDRENNYIAGIYNYCDRWCERCHLTKRCFVYAQEQEDSDDIHDLNQEAFWRKIADSFTKAKELLEEIAEERGIDLNAIDYEEIEKEEKANREKIKREDLLQLAESYAETTSEFVKDEDFIAEIEKQNLADYFQIIVWYHLFIAAKIFRAISAQQDELEETDPDLSEFPSDADGSAKIALIGIDRSIAAWHGMINKENLDRIKPQISKLEKIRKLTEEKFPQARNFIRPGFDEIETVM